MSDLETTFAALVECVEKLDSDTFAELLKTPGILDHLAQDAGGKAWHLLDIGSGVYDTAVTICSDYLRDQRINDLSTLDVDPVGKALREAEIRGKHDLCHIAWQISESLHLAPHVPLGHSNFCRKGDLVVPRDGVIVVHYVLEAMVDNGRLRFFAPSGTDLNPQSPHRMYAVNTWVDAEKVKAETPEERFGHLLRSYVKHLDCAAVGSMLDRPDAGTFLSKNDGALANRLFRLAAESVEQRSSEYPILRETLFQLQARCISQLIEKYTANLNPH